LQRILTLRQRQLTYLGSAYAHGWWTVLVTSRDDEGASGRAPACVVDDAVYAAFDLDTATVVDYVPARDENTRPSGARPTACRRMVAALVAVICLALLVYCLIERQVRRALGGDQKMPGLHPGHQMVRPTGRMIRYHLSGLRLRVSHTTGPPTIVISRGVQLHLLDLLGLEPTQPRWPET
jgi:hypothetical protein